MALTDVTDGSRIILQGLGPSKLALTGTVLVGDLVTELGVQADGNSGNLRAKWVAGEAGVSGDTITVYKAALIDGLSGGTKGDAVFLSDTAGGYSATASTTSRQWVGISTSATAVLVEPDLFVQRFSVAIPYAAADVVASEAAKHMLVAPRRVRITKVTEIHGVVAGQAGTMDLKKYKVVDVTYNDATATAVLGTTKLDLTSAINVAVSPTLTTTAADLILEVGEYLRLSLATGAATSLANGLVVVEYEAA